MNEKVKENLDSISLAEREMGRKELSMFWNRMLGALSNYVEPKTWQDCIEVARGDRNGS